MTSSGSVPDDTTRNMSLISTTSSAEDDDDDVVVVEVGSRRHTTRNMSVLDDVRADIPRSWVFLKTMDLRNDMNVNYRPPPSIVVVFHTFLGVTPMTHTF